jgi:tetratricopeptide (TPR) repeat protein
MDKTGKRIAVIGTIVIGLAGCSSATFHEDAGRRLENGSPADIPGAIAEYQQAAAADPRNIKIQQELSEACYKNNDFKQADEAARKAVDLDNNNIESHMILGKALLKRDANNDAIEQFNMVFTLNDKFPEAALLSGKTYEEKLGDNKTAADRYRLGIKTNPNSVELHEALAQVLSKLGDMQNAEEEIKIATRLKQSQPKPQS